jgi:6-phosphogluconolactonase
MPIFVAHARKDELVKSKRVVIYRLCQSALFAVLICIFMPLDGKGLDGNRDELGKGRVYVMTNQAPNNIISILSRLPDGTLNRIQEVSTGGSGSGPGPTPPGFPLGPGPNPLDSADSMTMTKDGRFLLAVNARSNDVSVLEVTAEGLRLVDKAPTQGVFPVSVTTRGGLVYVVNQGQGPVNSASGPASISGFFLDHNGKLAAIPHSTRIIGELGAAPGKVAITPDGELLVVAETASNFIDVFHLREDGRTGSLTRFPSNNLSPLAIDFTHHRIVAITEADSLSVQTGNPNGSSTSTYRITDDDALEPVSKAVPNFQTSTCWIRFTPDGRYAFTGNSGSGTISSYRVSPIGELTLLASIVADTGFASVPIDFDVSPDGKLLYIIASFVGKIEGFRIEEDGSLIHISDIDGFPVSMQGIVVR